MSSLVKSTVLSLGLLAGAAASAYAQSENIAALPPDAAATPAPQGAVVAPSPRYVGPDPGITWSAAEKNTGPVQPSPKYVGPDPGVTWGAQERQTQPVQPSQQYVGPSPTIDWAATTSSAVPRAGAGLATLVPRRRFNRSAGRNSCSALLQPDAFARLSTPAR